MNRDVLEAAILQLMIPQWGVVEDSETLAIINEISDALAPHVERIVPNALKGIHA